MFGTAYGDEAGVGSAAGGSPFFNTARPERTDMDVENTLEMTVAERFVTVPGGRIFVRQWQPLASGKAPLILLHDSLGSVAQWRAFPAMLAARLRRPVIAYDRLGFGQSSLQPEPARASFIDDEAQHILPALVQALGLSRYLLLGHSVGGAGLRGGADAGRDPGGQVSLRGRGAVLAAREVARRAGALGAGGLDRDLAVARIS